jgi:SAM-dependent methyltransferase
MPFRADPHAEEWRHAEGDTAAYSWLLCRNCGNAYPSEQPRLVVLQKIWNASRTMSPSDAVAAERIWDARRRAARLCAERSFRLFSPHVARQPGRTIDIACGLGETVRRFGEAGWQAEGIDADPNMAEQHRRLGIATRIGQFETMPIDGRYDLIQIAHAIYFMTPPMRFLGAVRERLAPGGVFGIVLADFMAAADRGLPSYAHSFFPTAASMRAALALAGFETLASRAWSGSIYIVARARENPPRARVLPGLIHLGYRTKPLRYALLGRPYLALRRAAKRLLRR